MKRKIPVSEKGIVARLINWGLCQNGRGGGSMSTRETRRASPYGGQGYRCMTDVACTYLREAAYGPKGGPSSQSKLDFKDAEKIEGAWRRLSIRHQLLLKDRYVLGKSIGTICRQLNIKQTANGHHWNSELAAAQEAIDDLLTGGNR